MRVLSLNLSKILLKFPTFRQVLTYFACHQDEIVMKFEHFKSREWEFWRVIAMSNVNYIFSSYNSYRIDINAQLSSAAKRNSTYLNIDEVGTLVLTLKLTQ